MFLGLRTYLKLAAGLGLEPRYSPPEGDVLPLDDPANIALPEDLPAVGRRSGNGIKVLEKTSILKDDYWLSLFLLVAAFKNSTKRG